MVVERRAAASGAVERSSARHGARESGAPRSSGLPGARSSDDGGCLASTPPPPPSSRHFLSPYRDLPPCALLRSMSRRGGRVSRAAVPPAVSHAASAAAAAAAASSSASGSAPEARPRTGPRHIASTASAADAAGAAGAAADAALGLLSGGVRVELKDVTGRVGEYSVSDACLSLPSAAPKPLLALALPLIAASFSRRKINVPSARRTASSIPACACVSRPATIASARRASSVSSRSAPRRVRSADTSAARTSLAPRRLPTWASRERSI